MEPETLFFEAVPGNYAIFQDRPEIAGIENPPAPVRGYDLRRSDDSLSLIDAGKKRGEDGANLVPPKTLLSLSFLPRKR